MHPRSPKWLDDVADATAFITEQTTGKTLADYQRDRVLRSVVERNFEIAGEALRRLERTDPATVQRISSYRKVIGFRNQLVHGYDVINNAEVWTIINDFLPSLRTEVDLLLREAEQEHGDDPG
jgi:uncharacterized protein with HEPN domain